MFHIPQILLHISIIFAEPEKIVYKNNIHILHSKVTKNLSCISVYL